MPLQTTVVGAWRKPNYLTMRNWFSDDFIQNSTDYLTDDSAQIQEELLDKAVKEVLEEQEKIGISILTDGEMRRENYIWHFCANLEGFDLTNRELSKYRNGACENWLPAICGEAISLKQGPIAYKEWLGSQKLSARPVKYTLPGALTIVETVLNKTSLNKHELMGQFNVCLQQEVEALVTAGCRHIQIDEPCLLRSPELAVESIGMSSDIIRDWSQEVEFTIHLCCGYPAYLDQTDFLKADKGFYGILAPILDQSPFAVASIEDKEVKNDLADLLPKFKRIKVALGCVAVARSRVETAAEIRAHLQEALKYISPDRLIAAPDCGLGYLSWEIARAKLTNMVEAANSLP